MKKIITLMDDKIKQLERYNEITEKMITDEFDNFGELIDIRQDIITNIDGISLDIKQYVNEKNIEQQNVINNAFNFKIIAEVNSEIYLLQEKIRETNRIKSKIKENDDKAISRVKSKQDELKEEFESGFKTKQVIDYFATTSTDMSKGAKLNLKN